MEWFFIALVAWAFWAYIKSNSASGAQHRSKEKGKRTPPSLRITYVDANGEMTERDVSVKGRPTNERFNAWCYLRNEQRQFLFERVQGGVDLKTGEVLDRTGVFRHIHPTRKVPDSLS
jgi:hypothetical protein